ncbi:hypothetical protein [Thermococcus sp. 21S9]|uniref:hypothetical protein n=1 Tax=Thermococcus sp. 21S9 TaxID=1638223 RepID=UPI00143C74A1|nr:hypothetical protein [Thermococcus sp. 21S9]NJE55361.1 hypothetical protein [Thermococcus sp. 21S9]
MRKIIMIPAGVYIVILLLANAAYVVPSGPCNESMFLGYGESRAIQKVYTGSGDICVSFEAYSWYSPVTYREAYISFREVGDSGEFAKGIFPVIESIQIYSNDSNIEWDFEVRRTKRGKDLYTIVVGLLPHVLGDSSNGDILPLNVSLNITVKLRIYKIYRVGFIKRNEVTVTFKNINTTIVESW